MADLHPSDGAAALAIARTLMVEGVAALGPSLASQAAATGGVG